MEVTKGGPISVKNNKRKILDIILKILARRRRDRRKKMAIIDTGATDHCVVGVADVTDVKRTCNPIRISLPNGNIVQSTHTCRLRLPGLPKETTHAHIMPGLANMTLLSVGVFCKAGETVTFDDIECCVTLQGNTILRGTFDNDTGLWYAPIHPQKMAQNETGTNTPKKFI